MTDPLRALAQSTEAFYRRFDAFPAHEDVPAFINNFNEEVFELIQAAMDGTDQRHIAEEAADVFVTAIGVCFACGIDVEQIVEQMAAVAAKNDAKTHETHVVKDGKIRRRVNVTR
jgi:NTP pyrophosphatase (non-canonical NTP hydrolase)